MNRKVKFLSILVLVLLVSAGCGLFSSKGPVVDDDENGNGNGGNDDLTGVNIMINGSFEELDDSNFAKGWGTNLFGGGEKEAVIDDEVASDGDRSLRLSAVAADGESSPRPQAWRSISIDAEHDQGKRYRFRASYRTKDTSKPETVAARFYFRDVTNENIKGMQNDPNFEIIATSANTTTDLQSNGQHLWFYAKENAISEWKEIDVTFVPPLGTAAMYVSLWLHEDSGTIWWDDVRLERID